MLRRKLFTVLGFVVVMLIVAALGALWLMQGVLEDMEHNTEAMAVGDSTHDLASQITQVQVELYELQLRRERHLDGLIDLVDSIRSIVSRVGEHYMMAADGEGGALYGRIRRQLPVFERHVGALATSRDPGMAMTHNQAALSASIQLQRDALELGDIVRAHGRSEQKALSQRFRWTVLGVTGAFLLVINISVLVLLQMSTMVLRPVEKLVEASRQLGLGRFDHRVYVDQQDEFDELARAYNQLAEQLQAAEEHRLETLRQVALTLNHELNNAMAIIELQLQLLKNRSSDDPGLEKCLRQIRESLRRMTQTAEDLKRIRRVVLTDYVAGVKMLDLAQSVQDEADADDSQVGPDSTERLSGP